MDPFEKTREGEKYPSCFHQTSQKSPMLVMLEEKYLVVHQQSLYWRLYRSKNLYGKVKHKQFDLHV